MAETGLLTFAMRPRMVETGLLTFAMRPLMVETGLLNGRDGSAYLCDETTHGRDRST